ncbi:alternative sulfate transporter [Pseudozyma hubeiensis SY62]|uniref:Alternative sulfate transporter n=1 Tax=Pseudozyma hubeiensis (strain SY62) TaxID=1305764 RepID=R9NZD5_PSEHS|nr:alternative sulfate transporter [Pseudozyma hubeiensis SY62]GAC94067.1 alternative sulfate transporter [Pseudozyma hubeiensis SY62]
MHDDNRTCDTVEACLRRAKWTMTSGFEAPPQLRGLVTASVRFISLSISDLSGDPKSLELSAHRQENRPPLRRSDNPERAKSNNTEVRSSNSVLITMVRYATCHQKMFPHWLPYLCLFMVISYVLSQDIPEVVSKFDDARTLWNTLHTEQLLLGSLDTHALARNRNDPWQTYLRTHGDDIIATEWHNRPRGGGPKSQGTFNKISSMKRFVKAPGALGPFTTHDRLSESIARRLIEEYSRRKDAISPAATHGPPLIDFLGLSDRVSR